MTGDQETDRAEAQDAARALAGYLEAQLAAGADPAILATAALGLGVDLLAQAQGNDTAAKALALLAMDLAKPDPSVGGRPVRF